MLKLLGSLFILGGGAWARWMRVSAGRRELDTLADLLASLEQMAEEIRIARPPLPDLLNRLGRGRAEPVSAFFKSVSRAAQRGNCVTDAWRQGAEALPLPAEDRRAVSECGASLGGDEMRICKGIHLATAQLSRSLADKRQQRAEREKQTTALCFSAAALLVILLI